MREARLYVLDGDTYKKLFKAVLAEHIELPETIRREEIKCYI